MIFTPRKIHILLFMNLKFCVKFQTALLFLFAIYDIFELWRHKI